MDNIQDVEYEDVNNEKRIRGQALYYSTSQVATLLGETDSKIRYYTTVFDELLDIEISNKQRRYTDDDIQKLRFIIDLKNQGMTIKQIQHYAQEIDFNEEGVSVRENNPLSIQTLAKALMEEQQKQIAEMEERICLRIAQTLDIQNKSFDEMKDKIKEEVATTVDEVVNEALNDKVTQITNTVLKATEEMVEVKKHIEEIKIAYIKAEDIKPVKKGLFGWFK